MRSGETKVAKEKFYDEKKKKYIWDFNVRNIVISKLVKIKTNFKYFIGYLHKVLRPLVLIPPEMSVRHLKLKIKTINRCLSV